MTTAQRALDRLAKSITAAFVGFGADKVYPTPDAIIECSVPVSCVVVESSSRGAGFVGSGLKLTIGNRILLTNEHGEIVRVEQDGKELDLRQMQRDREAPKRRAEAAEQAKAGDFSKVDWGQG